MMDPRTPAALGLITFPWLPFVVFKATLSWGLAYGLRGDLGFWLGMLILFLIWIASIGWSIKRLFQLLL